LDPRQMVLCRRVSRSWRRAFLSSPALRLSLKLHYPRAREVRMYDQLVKDNSIAPADVFDLVAGRYHHLRSGIPHKVEKIPMQFDSETRSAACHFPIAHWEFHTMDTVMRNEPPFRFPRALWTYSNNHVVFPDGATDKLLIKNLFTGSSYIVPFDLEH